MKITKTVPFDEDFETMLICAERYAMGRQTYMPGLVVDYIKPQIPRLSNKALYVLKHDIEAYGPDERDPYRVQWLELKALVEEEQLKRERSGKRERDH